MTKALQVTHKCRNKQVASTLTWRPVRSTPVLQIQVLPVAETADLLMTDSVLTSAGPVLAMLLVTTFSFQMVQI